MGGGCGSARPQGGGWLGAAGALEGRNIVRVHVVVPEGFDNPGRPTGGNVYDRRVCAGPAEAGWDVLVTTVAAPWPAPHSGARPARARLRAVGVLGRHKGQAPLVEALAALAERHRHCVLAGPLARDPAYVEQLQARTTRLAYGPHIRPSGVLTGAALTHAYPPAD